MFQLDGHTNENEKNQQWLTHMQLRQEASLLASMLVSGCFCMEGWTDTNVSGKFSKSFLSSEMVRSLVEFFTTSLVVDIREPYRCIAFVCLPQWS